MQQKFIKLVEQNYYDFYVQHVKVPIECTERRIRRAIRNIDEAFGSFRNKKDGRKEPRLVKQASPAGANWRAFDMFECVQGFNTASSFLPEKV